MKQMGLRMGLLVGALLIVPVIAVFFVADRLVGLPFVPFDLFDWLARTLPGGLITPGIDAMVSLIGGLGLGDTAGTAKLVEQLGALGLFLLVGVVGGGVAFTLLQGREDRQRVLFGAALGGLVGLLMLVISAAVNVTASAAPVVQAVWILLVLVGWGAALGWVNARLARLPEAGAARPEAAARSEAPTAAERPSVTVEPIDRRQFLVRVGSASALITVAGAGLGALAATSTQGPQEASLSEVLEDTPSPPRATAALPNADAALQPAPGTRPEYTPVEDHYRIDINLRPPAVDAEEWTLAITGLVDNPLTLTLDDIRNNYEPMDQYVTLSCISNQIGGDLIGTTRWTGVSLQQILPQLGLQADAEYLKISSADGFYETLWLGLVDADERIMLCYAWDGRPLTVDHGFPLRIYIPDRYGMKQPKWITTIEVMAHDEEGYWVRRGWDEVARMKATSVIDTVATDAVYEENGQMFVPVGGIAHAGARGISRVEVSVDDGEWQQAQLRTPLSDLTWVIWRYDWLFEEGPHTFAVRCYDGDGALQITERHPPHPSGATGIHTRRATL